MASLGFALMGAFAIYAAIGFVLYMIVPGAWHRDPDHPINLLVVKSAMAAPIVVLVGGLLVFTSLA